MSRPDTELELLGGFLLRVDGERRPSPARPVVALLCRLAVDPEPLSRDHLARLLWPDRELADARHRLRRALSDLRRLLAGTVIDLTVTHQDVGLHAADRHIDVRRFRALAGAPDRGSRAAAMALYRGDLVEGFALGAEEFDGWLAAARAALDGEARRLCESLSDDGEPGRGCRERFRGLDRIGEAASAEGAGETRAPPDTPSSGETHSPPDTPSPGETHAPPDTASPGDPSSPTLDAVPSGGPPPLIGREAPLRQCLAALDASRRAHRGCGLLVRGEPGIGKTRLLMEVRQRAGALGFAVHLGRAGAGGGRPGREALAQVLHSLVGTAPAAGAAAEMDATRLPELPALLGLDTVLGDAGTSGRWPPGELERRAVEAVLARLRQEARRKALLILLDDVDRADALTRAVAPHIAGLATELPVSVLMTSQAAGEALDPEWRDIVGATPLVIADLSPLPDSEARRLARTCGANPANLDRVVERARGNPLFVEQLVRGTPPGYDPLGSFLAVVLAQLDRLPERDRLSVCAASVLGEPFTAAALEAVLGSEVHLDGAADAGMVVERDRAWWFHHELVADCVYRSLLPGERRTLHLRAAEHLQPVSAVLHARHLDLAGVPEATAALVAAAAEELERGRHDPARALLRRALERDPDHAAAQALRARLEG